EVAEIGQTVRGIVAPKSAYSRKVLDDINNFVKQLGSAGVAWIKPGPDGINAAPVVKNAGSAAMQAVLTQSGAQNGDTVLLMAGPKDSVLSTLGALRLELARRDNWIPEGKWNMLWVVDFPLLEFSPEENRWVSRHHPFTSPTDADLQLLETHPDQVRAKAYDLV